MKQDIVIDEIRAVRHRISEQFGHNTKALIDHYRDLEKKYQDRMMPVSEGIGAGHSRSD